MAIFTPSAVIGGISGNVGGGCFVNGSGSKVIRKSKRAVVSRSDTLTIHRALFTKFQRKWRTLSFELHQSWRTYANNNPVKNRLGVSSKLSGFQMYIRIQVNLFTTFGNARDEPPVSTETTLIEPIEITSSVANGIELNLPAYSASVITYIPIKGILLWTDSTPKFANNLKRVGTQSFISSASPTTIDISSLWESVFSLPILNQVIAVRTSYATTDHTEWGEFTQIVKTTA